MDFVLGLLKTQQSNDSIIVAVDKFSNMAHFILCQKVSDSMDIVFIFFKEICEIAWVFEEHRFR